MISVIVCTYNRAPILRKMLNSFFRQPLGDLEGHELIVVDNNSTDSTERITEEFLHYPCIQYVRYGVQGLAHARNRAWAEARGDYIAYLDDDVMVGEQWMRSLVDCIAQTGASFIYGRVHLVFKSNPPEWLGPALRPYLGEVDLGSTRLKLTATRPFRSVNAAIRKTMLAAHGGFDNNLGRIGKELLTGEDAALISGIMRAGEIVVYEPKMDAGHLIGEDRLEWDYFNRLYAGLGKTMALREPWRGRMAQMGRIVESLAYYGWSMGCTGLTRIAARNSTHHLTRFQLKMSGALLTQRWRILKSGGVMQ